MKEVKDRDAQFKNISAVKTACEEIGLPLISIDTKKEEVIGNFKRTGKVLSKGQPKFLLRFPMDRLSLTVSVKQDLMEPADKLNMNLLIMHYPPYCSKFNPIEHRLFAHITRSWSGAPLLSVKDAVQRAARTTTVKGLTVHVDINSKNV